RREMKNNNNTIRLVPAHIDDERLIAFLDGEVDDTSGREIQEHLESCWDCRIRLGNVELSIKNFFKFRNHELLPPPAEIPPTGPAVDLLRAQMTAFQPLTPAQSLLKGHLPSLGSLSRRVLALFNIS